MAFAIALGPLRAGWLDVELHIGVESYAFAASHVLNDPVRELADVALFVAHREYHGTARVTFWLEPAGYELAVIRDQSLELVLRHATTATPHLTAMR